MKIRFIRYYIFSLSLALLVSEADAQRSGRRRNDAPPAQQQQQPPAQQQQQQGPPDANYNPYGNIPIRVDSAGVSDTVIRKSLRSEDIFDKSFVNERTPLPYEHLRWDDALFAEKVWRELDLREKMNQTFRYEAEDDNGSQMFVDILLKAVRSGEVTAFADERFTTPMALDEIDQLTVGQADTIPVTDPNDIDKVLYYQVTRASFDANTVNKLAMKEEWVFDREASRMFVRILGIAPLRTRYLPNGREMGSSVMFWVYYPDLRKVLARHEVYNPKNLGYGRMTWEELFESRMFASYITKSTLDNSGNKTIRGVIKDPILALLEGENIKERIFNYEQDLWSY
ncbi:MAG: gliding motility protein GldN [Flavisolibacter sp.]